MKATSMGADARIYIFDYERYRSAVVPAFLRLLRDGSVDGPLIEAYAEYTLDLDIEDPFPHSSVLGCIDLMKHCNYLDAELGVRETFAREEGLYDFGWEERTCASTSCPARSDCPFHRQTMHDASSDVEHLLQLLLTAMSRQCLGEEQFLGRSVDCYFYWETLEELGVPQGHEIRVLLERLGRLGFLIGHQWTVGTEGIHGWLSPGETALLAQLLSTLDLPNYECSFQAMEQEWATRSLWWRRRVGVEFVTKAHHHPNYPFERLSLSFVRTVCSLAAREGKGVLWGNDIP